MDESEPSAAVPHMMTSLFRMVQLYSMDDRARTWAIKDRTKPDYLVALRGDRQLCPWRAKRYASYYRVLGEKEVNMLVADSPNTTLPNTSRGRTESTHRWRRKASVAQTENHRNASRIPEIHTTVFFVLYDSSFWE